MSIKEIWGAADSQYRNRLLAEVTKYGVPYATAYSWCTGVRRPRPLYQERVRMCVRKVFGVRAAVEELFPGKEG